MHTCSLASECATGGCASRSTSEVFRAFEQQAYSPRLHIDLGKGDAMTRFERAGFATIVLATTLAAAAPRATLAQGRGGGRSAGAGEGPLAALQFRPLGPEGNRVASIIGEPGNPAVVYIGAADGGVWKTTDGGTNWAPIFDGEDVSAIGALAMAPTDHNVVWAGTGEPWLIRPYYTMGDGVYKSTDAGRTWQHMGLDKTGHIARIIVDPHDANTVYVCAIGEAFRAQHQRGVFRTTDGGATWQQILYVNDDTGCSDLALDVSDSKTLYAGMWQVEIHRWNLNSGGPSSGVYVSRDAGANWEKLSGHGLPAADYPLVRSRWALRRRIRIGCTRWCRICGPACIAPTIGARRGSSSIRRTRSPSVRRTTRGSRSRRTMRIFSTFRRCRSACRATAGRRCFSPDGGAEAAVGAVARLAAAAAVAVAPRGRALGSKQRAGTITTCGSTRRTPAACSSPTTRE